jgi:hypothetical protein
VARATRKAHAATLAFDALTIEGALIAPAMMARIAEQKAGGQAESDYNVPKGLTLRDEIARYFRIGQALFTELCASAMPSGAATTRFVEALLRDVFGFSDINRVGSRTLDERLYPVTLEARGGRVPVVVVPPSDDLDAPSAHLPSEGHRRSAASAAQDWLNATDDTLWGLCSNGIQLRLVRDNASLTRPAFIEADLRRIFEGEAFADFAALWLLIHASRFGMPGTALADCALEQWREAGGKEGIAARERLRAGFEAALLSFGGGFLGHPDNAALRERVASGALPLSEYFGQLLRLVYRLIFLLAAEDRNLLHPPATPAGPRKLYADGYSVGRLRDHAVRRAAWDRHRDQWEGLLIAFAALAGGEPRLGLPALGGLFEPGTIADLDATRLANRDLMEAIYRLAWLKEPSGFVSVNWRDMETEELGSVYEGLLELTPRLTENGRGFAFAEAGEAKGNARKTSGSYYTPDSLVQALLDSALNPVLDRVEAEAEDRVKALLSVTVIDPACGSGHFLLAAARRIATRVARHRTGGVASAEDYRHALREVARACTHGVDRNPLAVELTKVALWIETVDPGWPLGFLDANIRCGDALLGVFDLNTLADGIPDAAYSPLTGDDKATARYYKGRNREERLGQGALDFARGGGRLPAAAPLAEAARTLHALPEDSLADIAEKRRRFAAGRADPRLSSLQVACDLYIAAFLMPKTGGVPADRNTVKVPTTAHVWDAVAGRTVYGPLVGRAQEIAGVPRAFHWSLEFLDIMTAGGFDLVLGNPPWDVVQLGEEEYFAERLPELSELPGEERARAILALEEKDPIAFHTYQHDKRNSDVMNEFSRASGRFDLTARGKINTCFLFSELATHLVNERGRIGFVVKTEIATGKDTAPFFRAMVDGRHLISLYDFENREGLFDIHRSYHFCLFTLGVSENNPLFAFNLTNPSQITDEIRVFTLMSDDIRRMNPNTGNAIVIATRGDAEILRKMYRAAPILIEGEGRSEQPSFRLDIVLNQFSSSNRQDRSLFVRNDGTGLIDNPNLVPVLRGSLVHQFEHRFATFEPSLGDLRALSANERSDPTFEVTSDKYIPQTELCCKLERQNWTRFWLFGWRDQVRATDYRTMIAAVVPRWASDDSFSLLLCHETPDFTAALLGNLNSLCIDFVVQRKITTFHIRKHVLAQLPVFPPRAYAASSLAFLAPRVLELTYTSQLMAPFARDLGYDGPPFAWDEDRRANLRAELDAFYARAYGLTRDELRYILDPEDAMGAGYPSETFRVLKNNEIRRFGEYRTARLVLAAWDAQEAPSYQKSA